ncbi:MAG: hypothetical protein KDF67_20325, partial [Ottowia sp.]|nr:hypothetical protein [Ottowia sp.]
HSEVGARVGLFGRSLKNPDLARLNFGVFALHFILMASFLVVPGLLERVAGVDRAHHWWVYLPVLFLSIAGMVPMMRQAERGGRPRAMFLLAIALLLAALLVIGMASVAAVLYLGLW